MKTLLITGSGGFIGGNLKKYFNDKYNLLTPRSYELDLCNSYDVEKYFVMHDIDFIIHCSSVGGIRGVSDNSKTVEDNLSMIDNILLNKKKETKIILFGSGAMYARNRNLCKVKENEIGEYIPTELYGKSKLLISQKIKERKDTVMLNIFGCYGYNEKSTRFPSYAINQVISNNDILINNNCVFDYLFIEDLNKIVEYFLDNNSKFNIYNVTPTESVALNKVAEIINSFADKKVNIKLSSEKLGFEYTGCNELLLNELIDFKFTSLNIGLKKLYDYIKSNK